MNKNIIKNIVIILLIIVVIVLAILLILKYNEDSKSELGDFSKVIDLDDNENTIENSNNVDNDENITINDNNLIVQDNEEETYTEDDLVNYFNNMEDEINKESNLDKFKTTFKDKFTSIVDFIFYDKEIKGYKFKDLTSTAKLKVIAAAIKIDSKIDEKVPNYKDKLSDKYKDIKSELVVSYLDLTVNICSNHEEGCDKAKKIFGEIKDKGKIGLGYIKDILSKGKNKLKDYYEIYRDS